MIPPFGDDGLLPPGIHTAAWRDIRACLGFNDHRRSLLLGAYRAVLDLQAAGCRRMWLDGSFVTSKERPADFDLAWQTDGVVGALLHPTLLKTTPPRHEQQARYGGDILPNVIERGSGMPFLDFFRIDAVSGKPKGIIEIRLSGEDHS